MRRHIGCDNGPCSHNRTLTDMNSICDDATSPKPDIVLNNDTFCCDPLLDERFIDVGEYMIDGNDLREWRGINSIPNHDATLPANDTILTDQTLPANPDTRVGKIPKIVNVENRAMHHDRIFTNLNPIWASMKISRLIQINTMMEVDAIGKT